MKSYNEFFSQRPIDDKKKPLIKFIVYDKLSIKKKKKKRTATVP